MAVDTLRVCAVQMAHGPSLEENLRRAWTHAEAARDGGAHLVLLPEYFFAPMAAGPAGARGESARIRGFLADASRDLDLALAGNVVEDRGAGLRNVGVVYDGGRLVLEQDKVHPMPREAASGIVGGDRFATAAVRGVPTGVLVCADILFPEAPRILAIQGAEVLLNPVMSPYKEEDDTKGARESLFVARAWDAGAFVVKAGGFHRGVPPVAGRSLVTAPWGILGRYRDDFREERIFVDLDLARLRAFRKGQEGFPRRRPEAYRDLL